MTLCLLAFSVALHSVACGHVFFHEPSAILVKPGGISTANSDFGFAMGHWNDSLIVSSPSSDLVGEVYRCPLAGILNNSLSCSYLNLFNSTTFSRYINPKQNFFLGASIAATSDYLFTCAPLVTKDIRMSGDTKVDSDAIGSCFVYSNNISTEYRGPEARYIRGDGTLERIQGGTGWTTLADEENGFLIVAKTSVYGDINYLSLSSPLEKPEAFSDEDMRVLGEDNILDMGYGITAGKFFSNETVYAISKQNIAMTGQIIFLEEVKARAKKTKLKKRLKLMVYRQHHRRYPYMINNEVVGAMFGYALAAADLTSDGLSELLVGAPLQSEDVNEVEFGALHIYLGGDIKCLNDRNRIRTIFGAKTMGRFGTTIAASDIDGDSIPEVFVSAPYENSGVVYTLSGYELKNTLLQATSHLTMQVSKLQHTQKVVRSDLALLGFSLLAVPDVDGNGCNELAIGAPGAGTALLLRCLQTINVTVTSELKGLSVMVKDTNFTAKVCLKIGYNTKSNNISGYISVKNDIDGSAKIRNPFFKINLSDKIENPCTDIVVDLLHHEMYDYVLRTKAELENTKTLTSIDFDESWVQLSTHSETECSLTILRRCSGDDCNPKLSLDIKWNHPETTIVYDSKGTKSKTTERRWYDVESSEEETVSIVVENNGYEASEACVWVEITGAPVYKPGKCSPKPPQNPKGYECTLPSPFRQTENTTFEILLNMSRLSNEDKALVVTARLYEKCYQKISNTGRDGELMINYRFKEAWQKVQLSGVNHDLLITDIEISEEELKNNDVKEDSEENKENIFKDDQQYWIINNGSVIWNRSVAVIEVEKRPFITKVGTSEDDCTVAEKNQHTFICPFTLPPGDIKKIIAWAEMSRKEVGDNLNGRRRINVTSQMTIYMDYSLEKDEFIRKSLVTHIKMKKDISFKNNKMLIGLIAAILALLLLALVTFCLFKNGFFKREEKKKLNVLRESVRRRSIRLASEKSSRHSQKSPSSADGDNDIDIEVVEDSPFEDIPVTSKDKAVLIEAQADVHHPEENTKNGKEEHAKKA